LGGTGACVIVLIGMILAGCYCLDILTSKPSFAAGFGDTYSSFVFIKMVTDSDGKKYVIGEVSNPDIHNNIISTVYFSKSNYDSAYYSKRIGVVPSGMGIPFKIPMQVDGEQLELSDIHVISFQTLDKPNSMLLVDYNSLIMDPKTHAISGILSNKSPYSSFGIKVLAIAMDNHSNYLDVVESKTIVSLAANKSASFTLVPMISIASQVAYYSCFAPTSSGSNYTLPAENGQNLQLEVGGDADIENVRYNPNTHTVNLSARGVFPMGGFVDAMILSGPDSFINSDLVVKVDGQNATKAISSQWIDGRVYKHIEFSFPYGDNSVSIQAVSTVPEFPAPALAMMAAFGAVIVVSAVFLNRIRFNN
jgi:hypothetical protein